MGARRYRWLHVGVGGERWLIYLLSGGTSEADSWFIGASESGDDVFVVSRAQLAPEDHDDAFNLFDVRVGGVQPVTAAACTGTGCQGVPEPAPTFATPSSVTFNGVGNFAAPAEPTPVKGKSKVEALTRAQKLTKALKACRGRSALGAHPAKRPRVSVLAGWGASPSRSSRPRQDLVPVSICPGPQVCVL